MEKLVQNISDTALWVAVFRADESERPDAIFVDPYARELAGTRGQDIANRIGFSRKNSWSFVARTFLFDECIRKHVPDFDTVINLAAGLDTRPYRMQLPPTIKWIEIDLPGILEYKENILSQASPGCEIERIGLDLADRKARRLVFDELGKRAGKALILSEGLLIYLDSEDAGTLADDLSSQKSFRRWVFDLSSPAVLAMAQAEMGPHLKEGNAIFQFAPEEGEAFFNTHGWESIESLSKFKTAGTLKRLPEDLAGYASVPEPEGPRRNFPWSGVCLFQNRNAF